MGVEEVGSDYVKKVETRKEIIISTDWIGYHSWPDAPDEVAFLRNKHRHKFECRVGMRVDHNDRDLEFFMQKRILDDVVDSIKDKDLSCEEYAERIAEAMNASFCEVFEDGENGARITKEVKFVSRNEFVSNKEEKKNESKS